MVAVSRHKMDGSTAAQKMGGGTPGEVMSAAYFLSEIIRRNDPKNNRENSPKPLPGKALKTN
jgi:hypothetical protein